MKATTEIISRARRNVAELSSSAHWTETHLYAAGISFQDGNVQTTQKELKAARLHALRWKRKATAIVKALDEAHRSTL